MDKMSTMKVPFVFDDETGPMCHLLLAFLKNQWGSTGSHCCILVVSGLASLAEEHAIFHCMHMALDDRMRMQVDWVTVQSTGWGQ